MPATSRFLDDAEGDRLGAFPERQAPQLGELLEALDDRGEVVPRERARLRREGAVAVRKQQLCLAHAARVEQQLPRRRVARGVLGPDPELAVAPRDPVRL